ncbi:heavy metal translocating P-type ATPase [Peribacillus sp. NPDC097295]|uniref:heavy metal translocating P-type ATPase n=1 Tax=Peribacillus sp. NPDC097295 TaxID=3364402 RepID=UPI0038193F92
MDESQYKTYRIQGLSCTNCAAKFENNVRGLDGVKEAKINFGASKISVSGSATIEDIEKAGAFDNLKIRTEQEQVTEKEPIWKQKENLKVVLSAILLFISWMLERQYGEGSLLPVLGYGTAILVGGYSLFMNGLKNLIRLRFDMHTLMTVAIIGAAVLGEWGEGATVVILFAISEALEKYSMDKARNSIESLMNIAPKEALIRRGHHEMMMAVDAIEVGDTMIVKPGQKLAMDGRIIKGASTLNQAAITGESEPLFKTVEEEVFAGTLNGEGLLEVEVTKRVEDTTIAKIIHLVEEAQAEKAPSQAFVDKFAKFYTPAIMLIALALAIIPPLMMGGEWGEWIYRGLTVLVVGCPCALVISTPIAIVTAIGNAAKNGVLIKGGIHLEEAGALKAIAFDKTGTLTKGRPEVTNFSMMVVDMSERDALGIAAALESRSQHPLGTAILQQADSQAIDYRSLMIEDFTALTGKGLKGTINQEVYYIGKPNLFDEVDLTISESVQNQILDYQNEGKTVMVLGNQVNVLALIAVADEIRESSKEAISKLHALGIEKTIMLTGDNIGTAKVIGAAAGVHEIQAELLPQDKLSSIKQWKQKYDRVAMVGDGVNDAPALAASTVGIAMGGAGTDTALETADIALMGDDLSKLPYTISLSRKTLKIIKQNITFSLAIKVVALLLIAPGWLTLWMAIFADMGATLLVTLNSLRLLRIKE